MGTKDRCQKPVRCQDSQGERYLILLVVAELVVACCLRVTLVRVAWLSVDWPAYNGLSDGYQFTSGWLIGVSCFKMAESFATRLGRGSGRREEQDEESCHA